MVEFKIIMNHLNYPSELLHSALIRVSDSTSDLSWKVIRRTLFRDERRSTSDDPLSPLPGALPATSTSTCIHYDASEGLEPGRV